MRGNHMAHALTRRLYTLVFVTACIAVVVSGGAWYAGIGPAISTSLFLFFVCLACEFVDSTFGMGFGTLLTPLLLLAGFEAKTVVPVILLAELLTGASAAIGHHRAGSVNFHPSGRAFHVGLIIGLSSVIGSIIAVNVAAHLPKDLLNTTISGILLCVGIFMLVMRDRRFRFSWLRIVTLGVVASFNKAISGGGYGPLVVSGQLFAGVEHRSAIAIASFAELFTCLSGLSLYLMSGRSIEWTFAVPIVAGALCSVPFSVIAVKHIKTKLLHTVIACIVIGLSAVTFVAL